MAPTRALSLLAILATCAIGAEAGLAQAASRRAVPRTQRLVVLRHIHRVFAGPGSRFRRVGTVAAHRPLTAAQTALPVLYATPGPAARTWLRVRLPGRPNSHTGWISLRSARLTSTPWNIRVDLGDRRVRVFRSGRLLRSFSAVVGKPSTPTPHGRFFVEETVRLASNQSGAPFALALSARSNILQSFDGGPGQIALHGLGGVGGVPGTAASHGCLRLYTSSISWLAARIGPGVPVTITG